MCWKLELLQINGVRITVGFVNTGSSYSAYKLHNKVNSTDNLCAVHLTFFGCAHFLPN